MRTCLLTTNPLLGAGFSRNGRSLRNLEVKTTLRRSLRQMKYDLIDALFLPGAYFLNGSEAWLLRDGRPRRKLVGKCENGSVNGGLIADSQRSHIIQVFSTVFLLILLFFYYEARVSNREATLLLLLSLSKEKICIVFSHKKTEIEFFITSHKVIPNTTEKHLQNEDWTHSQTVIII